MSETAAALIAFFALALLFGTNTSGRKTFRTNVTTKKPELPKPRKDNE